MSKNKAIVLLSGGLDSYVALDIVKKEYDVVLGLNFNYGQKAFNEENEASKVIADKYNLKLQTINLPYLENIYIGKTVDSTKFNLDNFSDVWVPNRNGLFINIAGCFCDKYNIQKIVMGLNKEEAQNFQDNSPEFIESINKSLYYSTQNHPEVIAPCSNMSKIDIINYTIDNNLPLNVIKSCYDTSFNSGKKHCNRCMSCKLLYNAIKNSKKPELVEEIF